MLLMEESDVIDGVKENAISVELRTHPTFQAFQIEDFSFGRLVVIHRQQRIGPRGETFFVLLFADREIAMAILRRSPDSMHLTAIDEMFGERPSPILVPNRAGIRFAARNRTQHFNFA